MATSSEIASFHQKCELLRGIDRAKLFRPKLGDLSLVIPLQQGFEKLFRRVELAEEVAPIVPGNIVNDHSSKLRNIVNALNIQAERGDTEYVTRREEVIGEFETYVTSFLQGWTHFISAAVEQRGVLDGSEALSNKVEAALQLIRNESEKAIQSARQLAESIEKRALVIESEARATATGISIKDAQDQFTSAQENLRAKVTLWAVLSVVGFASFVLFAVYLLNHPPAVEQSTNPIWHVVYFTAIRVTILTAIGAAATFCLKMLRSHMHMSEYNLHRQRIANSMSSFVQAATTPEQRDQILGKLVDSVAAFGNSGLLSREDDSVYAPKMTIDAIMKSLPKSGG
jgi:hypothetical protein